MTIYMVRAEDGTTLQDGLDDRSVMHVASSIAKARGESVTVVSYYVAVNGAGLESIVIEGPGQIVPP